MTFFSRVIRADSIQKYKKNTKIVIPFFFTFANAILGLLAIIKALDYEFVAASYCILLATFMDSLDGRVARVLGSSSLLGMELDSLSDAISFCLAPAVLIYSWEIQEFGSFSFTIIALYLCAGLFRLAKFNIISNHGNNNWFLGLPTPVPAFLLASLVLHQHWVQMSLMNFILRKNIFFGLILLISFLMISKIKFPSFKQHKGTIFYIQFILFITMIYLCVTSNPYMLFIPLIYIIFGFSYFFYSKTREYHKSFSKRLDL